MKDASPSPASKVERHGTSNGPNSVNAAGAPYAIMVAAAKSQKKMWDAGSLLSDSQKEALASLAEYVAIRPLPLEAWRDDSVAEQQVSTEAQEKPDTQSAEQSGMVVKLYKALAESEAEGCEEEFGDVIDQQRRLKGMLALCDTILDKLSSVEGSLVSLQEQHDMVVSKTSAVHSECEKLTAEKTELEGLAKAIHNRLAHYDELENLQRQLALPTMQVASPGFLPLLTKIDEAIAHLATNAHFENTAVYLGRFRQLQGKAMSMVKAHVTSTLTAATERVHAVLKETGGGPGGGGGEGGAGAGGTRVESAVIAYVQYQAVAEGVKALMVEMARRAVRSWEYAELLDECQESYFKQRHSILHAPTVSKLHAALSGTSLGEGLRVCCGELCDLCHREHKLLQHFFPALERGGLPMLLDPLCTELVDAVRPMLLKLKSVEELCGLALILKGEVLEDRIDIRGESLAPMRGCVSGLLNEVQERLTFRAQVYIRDDIHGFNPSSEDLDYPARLQRRGGGDKKGGDDFGEWCPVLPRTLALLSQLYTTVDTKIFQGLAQDAVAACTEALIACSKALARQRGPADGGLFLVMHLLKLREQIVPFDVDFSSTELNLDFSDTRSALASLISSRRSLFSWSTNNALLSLAKAPPRVYHTLRNAKKDLERELKHACEAFILLAASQVAEPCVAWVRKADALIPAGAAAARVSSLREHSFAQPDKVKELMGHVRRGVGAFNAETVAKLALYLANAQTRSVLLNPIRNNIVDAYARMHTYLLAEYQPEEYIAMGVLSPEELAAALGGHQVVLLTADPPTPMALDGASPLTESFSDGASACSAQDAARPAVGGSADLTLLPGGADTQVSGRSTPPQPDVVGSGRDVGVANGRELLEGKDVVERESAVRVSSDGEVYQPAAAHESEEAAVKSLAEQQAAQAAAAAAEAAAKDKEEREAKEAAARELAEKEAQEAAMREEAVREREAASRLEAEKKAQAAQALADQQQAAKEQAARELAAREQAAREQSAREEAAREEAAREQAAREQSAREEAAREEAAAARELAAREQAAREQAAKEEAAREQAAREQAAREEAAREQAAKEQAAREEAARQQAEREEAERKRVEREKAEEEARAAAAKAAAEAAAREQDRLVREAAAREQAERVRAEREAQELAAATERAAREAQEAREREERDKEEPVADEYGPWTGYGEEAGNGHTNNGRHDAVADKGETEKRNEADDAAQRSSPTLPHAAPVGAHTSVSATPAARPGLHRGARPLAGLHRGAKPAAAPAPPPAGLALDGGSGAGATSSVVGGEGLAGDLNGTGASIGHIRPMPPAPGLLPVTALSAGGGGLVPVAALGGVGGGSGVSAAGVSRLLASNDTSAAGVFGGGQLPPGFKLVDGEVKYVGQGGG